jgi:hypothetical protein
MKKINFYPVLKILIFFTTYIVVLFMLFKSYLFITNCNQKTIGVVDFYKLGVCINRLLYFSLFYNSLSWLVAFYLYKGNKLNRFSFFSIIIILVLFTLIIVYNL